MGEPRPDGHDVAGEFVAREGETAVVALSAFHGEPLTFSSRDHLLQRLAATVARWRE